MKTDDISNLQSPFDAIKETDKEGREWWNSRKLARLMGCQKVFNLLYQSICDFYATTYEANIKSSVFTELQLSAAIKKYLNLSENRIKKVMWCNCPQQFKKIEFSRTIAVRRHYNSFVRYFKIYSNSIGKMGAEHTNNIYIALCPIR